MGGLRSEFSIALWYPERQDMYAVSSDGRKRFRVRLQLGRRCALAALFVGFCAAQAPGQCLEEKLTAPETAPPDFFGWSASLDGDTAILGVAPSEHCESEDRSCGSAHVYRFNGVSWAQEQKLITSDPPPYYGFGASVSVSGDTALVGAPYDSSVPGPRHGAVYVFRFDGTSWVQTQRLVATNQGETKEFGGSVAVSGNTAVIGVTWYDFTACVSCPAAYVFRFNGISWIEEQELFASDAWAGGFFRTHVSVDGDTVLVGAPYDGRPGSRGSVYVYRFNGSSWVEEQKLTESNAASGNLFGRSVSVSGDTALVGKFNHNSHVGCNCGSAYVFRFTGTSWIEEQQLLASDGSFYDRFGASVSVSGDVAVVGAFQANCAGADDCGAAYIFRFNGASWLEEHKLTASAARSDDEFGRIVSASGHTVLVTSFGADCAAGGDCGSAYVFSCVTAATAVNLDIKPGSCPNMVNPKSRGVVPVAIIGSLDFDVAAIDPESLTLARVDGVGGIVSPLSGRRGRGIVIKDVATPFVGEPCACHEVDRDGIDDLAMKFSTSEMSRAFELNGLSRGTSIELMLQGTLQDGTTFEGVDCIVVPGTERNSIRRHHIKRP